CSWVLHLCVLCAPTSVCSVLKIPSPLLHILPQSPQLHSPLELDMREAHGAPRTPTSGLTIVHPRRRKVMKRWWFVFAFLAALSLADAFPVCAQMGMDLFKRPAITKVFHPIVGKGAAYLSTDKDGKTRNSEISVVGKDSVDGKEGFWMEFVSNDNNGKSVVGK